MTGSRRLATVLRVAALQERLARAEAGRAAVAVETARSTQTARQQALVDARLLGGSSRGPGDLQQALSLQGLRAQAVTAAAADVVLAQDARTASVTAWSGARARARLLEELDGRLRAEREAAALGAAQRLADDLTGGRRKESAR